MDHFFRSFFGFSNPQFGNENFDDQTDQEFNDFNHQFNGENFNFNEPFQMMRHFEEVFRNMGLAEFFPPSHSLPGFEDVPIEDSRPENPRDEMLKGPSESYHQQPPVIGPWSDSTRHSSGSDEDTDLDHKVQKDGLRSIMVPPQSTEPRISKSFQSISIRTRTDHNGKIEEHRTIRDSQGNEETTVTRILGDEKHSYTTKKDPSGSNETVENFVNIDERSLPLFNDRWSGKEMQTPAIVEPEAKDNSVMSLFKNFFGLKSD